MPPAWERSACAGANDERARGTDGALHLAGDLLRQGDPAVVSASAAHHEATAARGDPGGRAVRRAPGSARSSPPAVRRPPRARRPARGTASQAPATVSPTRHDRCRTTPDRQSKYHGSHRMAGPPGPPRPAGSPRADAGAGLLGVRADQRHELAGGRVAAVREVVKDEPGRAGRVRPAPPRAHGSPGAPRCRGGAGLPAEAPLAGSAPLPSRRAAP